MKVDFSLRTNNHLLFFTIGCQTICGWELKIVIDRLKHTSILPIGSLTTHVL